MTKNKTFRARLLAVSTILFGVGTIGFAAGTTHKFKDVESLMDKIEDLGNAEVSVAGEVEDTYGNSFVLEGGGIVDDEVTVVFGKDISDEQKQMIQNDAKVVVEGTVKRGRLADAETELGYRFDDDMRTRWNRVDRYIVAKSVRRQAE